jgi:hypothetical protein
MGACAPRATTQFGFFVDRITHFTWLALLPKQQTKTTPTSNFFGFGIESNPQYYIFFSKKTKCIKKIATHTPTAAKTWMSLTANSRISTIRAPIALKIDCTESPDRGAALPIFFGGTCNFWGLGFF